MLDVARIETTNRERAGFAVGADARAMNDDVQTAEAGHSHLDELLHLIRAPHVADLKHRLATPFTDECQGLFALLEGR